MLRMALLAALGVAGVPALADQGADIEHSFMMVPIDFDVAHAVLLQRCGDRFPETVGALRSGIDAWRAANRSAQLELREYLRMANEMPATAADEQSRQMTLAYAGEFRRLGDAQLREFCLHYSDVSLRLAPMKFSEILPAVKAIRPQAR